MVWNRFVLRHQLWWTQHKWEHAIAMVKADAVNSSMQQCQEKMINLWHTEYRYINIPLFSNESTNNNHSLFSASFSGTKETLQKYTINLDNKDTHNIRWQPYVIKFSLDATSSRLHCLLLRILGFTFFVSFLLCGCSL